MEGELAELRAENARLRGLLGLDERAEAPTTPWKPTLFSSEDPATPVPVGVDRGSPPEAKVALFRSLFAGREDVYAERWDNERTGKAGWGPALKGGWANARRPDREYLPYTHGVIEKHLAGGIYAGLYPLLRGDTCWLLVSDFDGPGWPLTLSPTTTPPGPKASRPCWNARVQVTAGTCGCSSPARCRHPQPDGSASTSSARR